jgi:class 3 adenylate cyclase
MAMDVRRNSEINFNPRKSDASVHPLEAAAMGMHHIPSEVVSNRLSLRSNVSVASYASNNVSDVGSAVGSKEEGDAFGKWDTGNLRRSDLPHAIHRRGGFVCTQKIQLSEEDEAKKPKPEKSLRLQACARVSRNIVDNKYVVAFSVVLTFFALLGDDLRVCFFEAGADDVFNIITILCIAFFSTEIILSCFGKVDYFLGFFFVLDTIATVTLLLDLTYVNEALSDAMSGGGDGNLELGDRARSGRTARIGASIARMVRVLRLLRIFKLYKAYWANQQRKKREAARLMQKTMHNHRSSNNNSIHPGMMSGQASINVQGMSSHPGHHSAADRGGPDNLFDEDQWLEEEEERMMLEETEDVKESQVSKKLSALTSRRVIILVLAMLLVLPSLRVIDPVTPMAPSYAADMIHEAFKEYENANGTHRAYENAMLKMIYYHNWFTGQDACTNEHGCPSDYFAHLFWFGAAGIDSEHVRLRTENTHLSQAAVTAWNTFAVAQDDLYNYGSMPSEVLPMLSSEWNRECTISDVKHFGISLMSRKVPDLVENPFNCPPSRENRLSVMRSSEWLRITPRMLQTEQYKEFHFVFYFDVRQYVKLEALYGMSVTGFVCVVLCVASVQFAQDANRLVLKPLEQMITKIEAIRKDPLSAIKMADQEFKAEEVRKLKEKKQKLNRQKSVLVRTWRATSLKELLPRFLRKKDESQEMYETVILEKTLIKLGWLLSLVFGEAGANIVSQNMSGNATAGVNAMVPGARVDCIIGHARIKHFSTATEVLQGRVMTFVNQVAEIVHGVVDQFHGAANQNNGDTFLLIWRMFGLEPAKVAKLGDMSVIAFATILGAIHRSPVLAAYRAHPGLQQRLGSNHRVTMTFGLHAGWAIEGAVGSEFKIDASYLSPNVTIAASLERATAQYGVSFLASQAVTRLCHKKTVHKCRLIDKVTISGCSTPLELFTLDLDCNTIIADLPPTRQTPWNVRQRFRARQLLETEKTRKWSVDLHLEDSFDEKDILHMRRTYTFEFLCLFNRGYQNYSQGEWQVAKRVLSQTKNMLGVIDGPSCALLKFMEATYQFVAPEGWNGVRVLSLDSHGEN